MTRSILPAFLAVCATLLSACASHDSDAPPALFLDDDMCAECGMIISDERFAGATIISSGGQEQRPLLFDDYNCMALHETSLTESTVVRRWVHDHGTRAWVNAIDATYLCSPRLSTPMASHVAAFEQRSSAAAMHNTIGGEVYDYPSAWRSLSLNLGCADTTHSEPPEASGGP